MKNWILVFFARDLITITTRDVAVLFNRIFQFEEFSELHSPIFHKLNTEIHSNFIVTFKSYVASI